MMTADRARRQDTAKRVSLTRAKAILAAVADTIVRRGERLFKMRRGHPTAAVPKLVELEQVNPDGRAVAQSAGALALLGLWAEIDDAAIDAFIERVMTSRARDLGRPMETAF